MLKFIFNVKEVSTFTRLDVENDQYRSLTADIAIYFNAGNSGELIIKLNLPNLIRILTK